MTVRTATATATAAPAGRRALAGLAALVLLAASMLGVPALIEATGRSDLYYTLTSVALLAVAAGVTFFTLLSLFPLLATFVTLYGLFADPQDAWGRLQFLYALLPDSIAVFLGGEMQRLAENSNSQLTFTLPPSVASSPRRRKRKWSRSAKSKSTCSAESFAAGRPRCISRPRSMRSCPNSHATLDVS